MRLAREAGELLLARFRGPARDVASKSSPTDLVSEADHAAEAHIGGGLAAARPDDGQLGEEGSGSPGSSGRRWVFDPLDGTVNFLYGHPAWCISIALEDADGSLLGVIHDPGRAETFTATRGGGAHLDGLRLVVTAPESPALALVATGFSYQPELRARQAAQLTTVLPRVRDVRRGGAAALDLAWLAAGRVDGYYEQGLQPWDWAAGRLLVTEAGGVLAEYADDPPGLAAAGPGLLPELLRLLSER